MHRVTHGTGADCGRTFDRIHVMRYMGTKAPLLPFLIPVLEDLAGPGGPVLDLMAGTHSVGYALKGRYPVWGNDVQAYSHVIGLALLANNNQRVSAEQAQEEVLNQLSSSRPSSSAGFFEVTYSDSYFSREQCREIDTLRGAIDRVSDPIKKALYLTALIYALCYAQSTPGHFAQFLPADHPRVQCLRALSVTEAFLDKCADLTRLVFSPYPCCATRATWKDLLKGHAGSVPDGRAGFPAFDLVDTRVVYVDPPYSQEQYSRFYHLLDTLVLDDRPRVEHRARYRSDRFKSGFCYRNRVRGEFARLFEAVAAACPCASVAVSYGSRGLISVEEIAALLREVYGTVQIHTWEHAHSSLGKGASPVEEYLVVAMR